MSAQTTSTQIIAASRDADLLDRLVATAARLGIKSPSSYVSSQIEELVSTPLDAESNTLASVYAYAVATYTPSPRPGENLAAVTDAFLSQALQGMAPQASEPPNVV